MSAASTEDATSTSPSARDRTSASAHTWLDVKVALEEALARFGDFAVSGDAPPVEKINGDTRGFQTLTLDLSQEAGR